MREGRGEDHWKPCGSHFHNIVPGFCYNFVEIELFSQNICVRETPREIPVQHFFSWLALINYAEDFSAILSNENFFLSVAQPKYVLQPFAK